MRRPTLVAAAILLLAAGSTAAAAPMEHHDLASLWWQSDDVILAEEISRQYRVEEWNETVWYRVVEVYKGDLSAQEQVEVYDDAYRYDLPQRWDWSDPAAPSLLPSPTLDPQVFLFLRESPPRQISDTVRDDGPLMKVPSGMRVVAEGRVYRFEQWANPGGYAPVPQGPDPDDIYGRQPTNDPEPLELTRFAVELEEAADRAQRCAAALAMEDTEARNAALLGLLPPPKIHPPATTTSLGGFPADALSREMQMTIAHSGDLDAVLEAFSRDVVANFHNYDARRYLDPDHDGRGRLLVDAALDTSRPTHQRAAALALLQHNRYALREGEAEALPRIATLLEDPEPAVRAAAARLIGDRARGDHQTWGLDTLVAAFQREPDPLVQHVIAQWLRTHDAKAARLDPLLTGDRAMILGATPGPRPPGAGDALVVGYRFVVPHHEWSPQLTLHAVARTADGTEIRSGDAEMVWGGGGQDLGRGLARFPFDPPLPAGRYQVHLEGHLEPYRSPDRAPADDTSNALPLRIPR